MAVSSPSRSALARASLLARPCESGRIAALNQQRLGRRVFLRPSQSGQPSPDGKALLEKIMRGPVARTGHGPASDRPDIGMRRACPEHGIVLPLDRTARHRSCSPSAGYRRPVAADAIQRRPPTAVATRSASKGELIEAWRIHRHQLNFFDDRLPGLDHLQAWPLIPGMKNSRGLSTDGVSQPPQTDQSQNEAWSAVSMSKVSCSRVSARYVEPAPSLSANPRPRLPVSDRDQTPHSAALLAMHQILRRIGYRPQTLRCRFT